MVDSFLQVLILLLSVVYTVYSYPGFRDYIPNGHIVPHPCYPGEFWRGVGHHTAPGGGERNPFGLDFQENGRVWNKTLCEKDSDLDGKTNGEELGDPDCLFERDTNPAAERNTSLSHPGVCEPPLSGFCLRANGLWINLTGCVYFEPCPIVREKVPSGASQMCHTIHMFITGFSILTFFPFS